HIMGRSWIALLVIVAACSSPRPPTPPPIPPLPPLVLTSPGPLLAGHGTAVCRDCHPDNKKEIHNALCLGCHQHQALAARIAAGKGFHASRAVKGQSCAACHLDHRGASYDPTGWANVGGRDAFDHALSGWALDGAHRTVECEKCHRTTDANGVTTYMGTDRL